MNPLYRMGIPIMDEKYLFGPDREFGGRDRKFFSMPRKKINAAGFHIF
jgi:hypothetical protein